MAKKNKKLKSKSHIDIGIPIFNESKYLLITLTNLSKFRDLNIRFIISDNCSTDNSSEICKRFIKTDKRFKYFFHKKKITSFKNFNYVFNKSNSKYFLWNSGHDLRSANFIRDANNVMEKDTSIALCYSDTKINGKKNFDLINIKNELNFNSFFNIIKFFYNLDYNYQIYGMFRSSLLKETKLFRNCIGGDTFLIKEIAFLGKISKLNSNSFTNLIIDSHANWYLYKKKHLNSSQKINFFKDFFISQLLINFKVIRGNEKSLTKMLVYVILFFFKLLKQLYYIYIEKIKIYVKKSK
jgi:glycosyltransferase involved in cell wall biosynthesis